MSDSDDLPIRGLDTLPVPAPGHDFWARVRADLVATAAIDGAHDGAPNDPTSEVVVRAIGTARSGTGARRVVLAAAAVIALVVAGLVVVQFVRSDDIAPAERQDVVVTDPMRIDLDGLRRESFGWDPHPTGPYDVFDVGPLEAAGWTVASGGIDVEDTNAVWDWRWSAELGAPDGANWILEVSRPTASPSRLTTGRPVDLRGGEAREIDDSLGWIHAGSRVRLAAGASSDLVVDAWDLDAAVDLANQLAPIALDELPPRGRIRPAPPAVEVEPVLAGLIDGLPFEVLPEHLDDTALSPGLSVAIDGDVGFGAADAAGPTWIAVASFGDELGRMIAGRADQRLSTVRAVLSDGHTVTVPIATHDGGSTWVVPIPIGLDVTSVVIVPEVGEPTTVPVGRMVGDTGTSVRFITPS